MECEGINWNLRNNDGECPLTLALKTDNDFFGHRHRTRVVQKLLSIPEVDLNIQEVFTELNQAAIEECLLYVAGVMDQDENFNQEENVTELVYVLLKSNLDRFANILASAPGAVEECRTYVAGVMARDDSLHPEDNVTELVYALKKNMDKFATILASCPKESDILCLLFHGH